MVEIFKQDVQINIPITKDEDCGQICRIQHTSKPRMENTYIHEDAEVLKFKCRKKTCPHRIREVIAGVRGDTLDQAIENANKTAVLVRKITRCITDI